MNNQIGTLKVVFVKNDVTTHESTCFSRGEEFSKNIDDIKLFIFVLRTIFYTIIFLRHEKYDEIEKNTRFSKKSPE